MSDVYAMGGEPKLALNIMCLADSMDDRTSCSEMLRGGYDKAYEAEARSSRAATPSTARSPFTGLAVHGLCAS